MWANAFRASSSWSQVWSSAPKPIMLLSTTGLCHITSAGSGSSPPMSSAATSVSGIAALGIRVVLVIFVPPVVGFDMKTPPAPWM